MEQIIKLKNRIESLNVMRVMYESALKDSVKGSYKHTQLQRTLNSINEMISECQKTIEFLGW